jgi:hypothetical protein
MKSKTTKKKKPKKNGPDPKYKPEFNNMAYIACREGGFTDVKLAALFSVSRSLVYVWKNNYPDFKAATIKGKDEFDTLNVEGDLLKNARGFKYTETTKEPALVPIKDKDNRTIGIEEKLVITKVVHKFKVPSTTAQIYWLKNRDRTRWKDKLDVDFNDLTLRRTKKRFDGEGDEGGKDNV